MTVFDQSLLDDFVVEGYWWLPGDQENALHGAVHYTNSSGELYLEIEGIFRGGVRWTDEQGRQHEQPEDIFDADVIHGISQDGKLMTVLQNVAAGATEHIPGYGRSKFSCSYLVYGMHLVARAEQSFRSCSVRFLGLDASLGERWLQQVEREDAHVRIATAEAVAFDEQIPDNDFRIRIRQETNAELSATARTISVRLEAWADVVSANAVSIDRLIELSFLFQHWLTIIHGLPSAISRIILSPIHGNPVAVFFRKDRSHVARDQRSNELFVRVSDLTREVLLEALTRWFNSSEDFRTGVYAFLGAVQYPHVQHRVDLINYCQAIEAFHRLTEGGEYMSSDEFEPIRQQLVAAIPDGIDPSLRQRLQNSIRYSYQFSQRRRFTLIFRSLSDQLRAQFANDVDALVGRIVETRNYYTHYDPANRNDALTDEQIAFVNFGLRTLMHILLIRHLGIPDEVTNAGLPRSSVWRQYRAVRNRIFERRAEV